MPASTESLMVELRGLGVELMETGGRLFFRTGPQIPPELRARMKEQSSELVKLLRVSLAPIRPDVDEVVVPGLAHPPLVLDFETFFDDAYSLRRMTTPEYVHDERFHVHGLAIRHPDGATEFRRDVTGVLIELQQRYGQSLEAVVVVGHNLAFDAYVLAKRFNLHPAAMFDTMLAAYHVHGRSDGVSNSDASLAGLSQHYGLPSKGDISDLCGVRELTPHQTKALEIYARNDVEITFQLMHKLLPQVTRPDVELPIMEHTLRLFVERGVRVDVAEIAELRKAVESSRDEALREAGVTVDQVRGDKLFHSRLRELLESLGDNLPLKTGKRGQIPATSRNDPAMHKLLEHDNKKVVSLVRARVELKGSQQKLARLDKLEGMVLATGGVLPVPLVYCGAHTGRFAGGGGFNVQNLGREGLGGRIRGLLQPRHGRTFVIADFAQIEARVTAWLSGQTEMLQAFAEGRDLYIEFASTALGWQLRRSRSDDPEDVKRDLDARRQVGKQAVLGLGYGMGGDRFVQTLRADTRAALLFETGELDPERCADIVRRYRQTYPQVPTLWKALEQRFQWAMRGREQTTHRVRLDMRAKVMHIWLPSGRALRYHDLRWQPSNGRRRLVHGRGVSVYGGMLTENVVQAIARDILVEAILRLEAAALPVAFHVHDEVIVEVETPRAEGAAEQVRTIMTEVPQWAAGLPLACEVSVADRYGKH